jgi:hypothetical protein
MGLRWLMPPPTRLSQLREWLTIEEAADQLSTAVKEPVNPAAVLRLALDGALRLALYLPAKVVGSGHPISSEAPGPNRRQQAIEGLCDLPIRERAKAEIEHRYHWLERRHYVPRGVRIEGAFVEQDGYAWQLPPDRGESGMSPRSESEFPHGSVLCVRREALNAFLDGLEPRKQAGPAQADENDLDPRERETLNMMIAALAKEAGVDISQPFKAAETVVSLITALGYQRSSGAVASHLARIGKQFPAREGK